MIIDGLLQFSGTAGIAGSTDSPTTGAQFSNNVIDLQNARDLGIGDDPALKVFAAVTTAFTGGTSIQVTVAGSTDNVTFTPMASGPVIVEANLIAGTHLCDIDLPRIAGALMDRPGASQAMPRYIRLNYTTVGTHGAGALFAALVLDRHDQIAYPPGVVIAN
jgi:hypothetical protein